MIDIQNARDYEVEDSSLSDILANTELCRNIENWSAPILVRKGEMLFRQGDAPRFAFLVKSGEIGLTMKVSGDALWRVRANEGSLVGLPAMVANEPYSMTAEALQDSKICRISRDNFDQLTQRSPSLCCNVLQILAAEVHAARRALSTLVGGLA